MQVRCHVNFQNHQIVCAPLLWLVGACHGWAALLFDSQSYAESAEVVCLLCLGQDEEDRCTALSSPAKSMPAQHQPANVPSVSKLSVVLKAKWPAQST